MSVFLYALRGDTRPGYISTWWSSREKPVCFTLVKVTGVSPAHFTLVKIPGREFSRGSIRG